MPSSGQQPPNGLKVVGEIAGRAFFSDGLTKRIRFYHLILVFHRKPPPGPPANAPVVGAIAYSMGQLYHAERQFPEALAAFHQVLTVKDIPPGPVCPRQPLA